MTEQASGDGVDNKSLIKMTTTVVAAYLSNNSIASNQISEVIHAIHGALKGLASGGGEPEHRPEGDDEHRQRASDVHRPSIRPIWSGSCLDPRAADVTVAAGWRLLRRGWPAPRVRRAARCGRLRP